MAQALRSVTGTLRVRRQPLHLLRGGWAHDLQLDRDVLEIRRRVIDVVFLSVAKGSAHVGGRVVDRYFVERREPRQLGEQSKRCPHHQELERRRSFLGAPARERLIGFDGELSHSALEVDVFNDLCHCSRRDCALIGRFGAHLSSQALDLAHLLVEIHAAAAIHENES
jgi:hypothetical protein